MAAADNPYFPDRDWQPIASYVSSFGLFRSAERGFFGLRDGDRWLELVDGEEYHQEGFVPTEWAPVAPEEIDAFAG
ncbi:hypothetical protein [Sphingomonas sp.]|uniref:hypothetical protein n=1 Tax=Sphingomonas sp. TaxID=28214 RepID=UPI0025F4DACB|nr:hypothetical protein [Sphingomonas sp.]MBV9527889.1 hypothetical protein [Sphingomonas sp.]